jgi:hypothetical protein
MHLNSTLFINFEGQVPKRLWNALKYGWKTSHKWSDQKKLKFEFESFHIALKIQFEIISWD